MRSIRNFAYKLSVFDQLAQSLDEKFSINTSSFIDENPDSISSDKRGSGLIFEFKRSLVEHY